MFFNIDISPTYIFDITMECLTYSENRDYLHSNKFRHDEFVKRIYIVAEYSLILITTTRWIL